MNKIDKVIEDLYKLAGIVGHEAEDNDKYTTLYTLLSTALDEAEALNGPDENDDDQVEQANADEDEKLIDSESNSFMQAIQEEINKKMESITRAMERTLVYGEGVQLQVDTHDVKLYYDTDHNKYAYQDDKGTTHAFDTQEQMNDYIINKVHTSWKRVGDYMEITESLTSKVAKCECGAHKVKDSAHSTWCPMYAQGDN